MKSLQTEHPEPSYSAENYRPPKPEQRVSMEQQNAIDLCCDLDLPIVGVTGGAGTGKTFVLGHVYAELRASRVRAVLCAPTGRAAKRIQELTGITAKTVHRLLEYPMPHEDFDGPRDEPRRNKNNPLEERVVFVDESSMISPMLYQAILNALPRNGVVRFFGDNNQLPPVEVEDESQAPFIEVLRKFPSQELTYNFRSEDHIIANSLRILRGKMPIMNDRFIMIYDETPLTRLIDFVKGSKEFANDDHQIITPPRKGKVGTLAINPRLQLKFNPKGPLLKLPRFDKDSPELGMRPGDKMIWVVNDYNLEIFNGEIGRVTNVDLEDGSLELQLQDRTVVVPALARRFSPYYGHKVNYDPRKQIECGYAITTHKAQGSEFDTVVYVVSRSAPFLLNKRNFYTAVTRAKTRVIVIADRRAMGNSLRPPY